VGVREYADVDADAPLGIFGLLGRVVRGFDAEDGVPLAGRFLFDRDGLDVGVVGQVAMEGERDVTEFREPQSGPTTRFDAEEQFVAARCGRSFARRQTNVTRCRAV
jgi:hypothetical protein